MNACLLHTRCWHASRYVQDAASDDMWETEFYSEGVSSDSEWL